MDILFTSQVKICKYIFAVVNRKRVFGSVFVVFCFYFWLLLSYPSNILALWKGEKKSGPMWLTRLALFDSALFIQLRSAWKSENQYQATVYADVLLIKNKCK